VLPLELPRSELFRSDDTPLDELLLMSLLFDPLFMPLEPTLPLVRLLGSFNEFSDCPIFCPKLAEDPLLLL
jgi:hypothetical protein